MRLWHYKLIPFLPKSQLLGQWRELNSIFKKQDKHILINYVYKYENDDFFNYSLLVIREMHARKYKTNTMNMEMFFGLTSYDIGDYCTSLSDSINVFNNHHNDEYLTICYWNLREKYIRGQKDFTKDIWEKIDKMYKEQSNETNI